MEAKDFAKLALLQILILQDRLFFIMRVVLVTLEEILPEVERVLLEEEQQDGQVLVQIQELILQ